MLFGKRKKNDYLTSITSVSDKLFGFLSFKFPKVIRARFLEKKSEASVIFMRQKGCSMQDLLIIQSTGHISRNWLKNFKLVEV